MVEGKETEDGQKGGEIGERWKWEWKDSQRMKKGGKQVEGRNGGEGAGGGQGKRKARVR